MEKARHALRAGWLDSISQVELKLMKFCQMCTDSDLMQKNGELENRPWENVKETMRVYNAAKDMETGFSPREGEKFHHISRGQ